MGQWNRQPLLLSALNTFFYDYLVRLRNNGTHLSDYLTYQMPLPDAGTWAAASPFCSDSLSTWVMPRVLELVYTSSDLASFARSLGDIGAPFRVDIGRRKKMKIELDAGFFHLYGVERSDVEYVMETFPIVKRKDLAAHGDYRTKRLILEVYDAMKKAIDTGTEYQTILDPPPGQGPRHPAKES